MTAPAHTLTELAGQAIAADRAIVTAQVGSYRDILNRGLDPATAVACVAGAAYTEMCSRRATQVLAAAVQIIAELQAEAAHAGTELAATRKMLDVVTSDQASVDRYFGPLAPSTGGER